jgi:trehalose 6-phosphate phosphatase
MLVELDAPLSNQHWRLVEAMVSAVESRWHEPDHGIWEIRRAPRHHVHSKVMCWLTVDRAITVARRFLDQERDDWKTLRDRIAADVVEHGFKSGLNAFTAAYDGTDIDAATLFVGLSGLLEPDDPRFAGTVQAVESTLRKGPTVYRYRADDGLPGAEGGFHICASWLVDAYVLLGRQDEARQLFEQITALAGPTGLLSEQYGPRTGRALGNVPQAYSHIGIIDNALRLARVARSSKSD